MGNWRTVDIRGKIDIKDVDDIKNFLSEDYKGKDDNWEACPFFMGHSLCGLGEWVNPDGSIDISANLSERDFSIEDVETALECLARRYPSLDIVLHAGSDYESVVCEATFHVKDGVVTKHAPEVSEIRDCICRSIWDFIGD